MLRNFLVTTYRNLIRNSFYSLINILGLSIGLAAGFLILQHVHHQLSYDGFFENKEISTVSYHTLKTSNLNPAKTLKDE